MAAGRGGCASGPGDAGTAKLGFIVPDQELWVTPSGSVVRSFGSRTPHALAKAAAACSADGVTKGAAVTLSDGTAYTCTVGIGGGNGNDDGSITE